MIKERIQLAEAMNIPVPYTSPPDEQGYSNVASFDPFTDANDDYAVLEWMRDHFTKKQLMEVSQHLSNLRLQDAVPLDEMMSTLTLNHRIGDYARAALEVINDS